MQIRVLDRSLLRRSIHIHHPAWISAPIRSQRRDPRTPSDPHLQHETYRIRKRPSHPPVMDWSSAGDSPCPSHPIRESRCFAFLSLPGDARQAMVEPLRSGRHARGRDRAQPEPTTKTGRDGRVVLRQRGGAIAADAAGRISAFQLRSVSLPTARSVQQRTWF